MNIPDDLRYSADHEWAQMLDDNGSIRVGITDFAQDSLGDVVYVDLPNVGLKLEASQPLGEVESTKSVSELYAPVSGTVTRINDALADAPELINRDPYGEGWLVEIGGVNAAEFEALLAPSDYQSHIDNAAE